jgi:hypothetical protein
MNPALEPCQTGPHLRPATFVTDPEMDVAVSHTEDWIAATMRLGRCDALELPLEWWLRWNHALPGPAKFSLTPERELCLQAEFVLAAGMDVMRVREEISADLHAAWAAAALEEADASPLDDTSPSPIATPDLKNLLKESGWEFAERRSGRVAVRLETGAADYFQAICEPQSGGGLRVFVELQDLAPDAPQECRNATAHLLLLAGHAFRLARGSFAPGKEVGVDAARLEVDFSRQPGPAELTSALEALAVACRGCGGEVRALASLPAVARGFLEQICRERNHKPSSTK